MTLLLLTSTFAWQSLLRQTNTPAVRPVTTSHLAWQSLLRQTNTPAVRPVTTSHRIVPPTMQGLQRQTAPPAPPPVDDGGGGDGDGGLILRDVSKESRRATLTLWQWQWQQRADRALEIGDMSRKPQRSSTPNPNLLLTRSRPLPDQCMRSCLRRTQGRVS